MFGIHLNHQQNRSLVVNVACSNPPRGNWSIFTPPWMSPPTNPPPSLCLPLPKSWISTTFSPPDLYTVAKKKKKKKKKPHALAAQVKGRALFLFRPTSFLVSQTFPNFSRFSFSLKTPPSGFAAARLSAAPPSAASPSCFTFTFESVTPEMLQPVFRVVVHIT